MWKGLSGDQLCFPAGPLLLNALLRHLELARLRRAEEEEEDGWDAASWPSGRAPHAHGGGVPWLPAPDSLAYGCGCVALLGLAAVLKVHSPPSDRLYRPHLLVRASPLWSQISTGMRCLALLLRPYQPRYINWALSTRFLNHGSV